MEEITPKKLRCGFGSCPGVFAVDNDNLLIIGKKMTPEQSEQLGSRIGSDEYAIVINRSFFEDLNK